MRSAFLRTLRGFLEEGAFELGEVGWIEFISSYRIVFAKKTGIVHWGGGVPARCDKAGLGRAAGCAAIHLKLPLHCW
jgi:hypothetical protein